MATIKLKSWRGNMAISEASGAVTKSLVLGQAIDFGGTGSVTVESIDYVEETKLTWYTLKPRNPGHPPVRLFMSGDGVGEPLAEEPKPAGKK